MIERQGLTLVGVALANLDDDDVVQLALPFDKAGTGALDAALDDVRDRFGSAAVTPGACCSAATRVYGAAAARLSAATLSSAGARAGTPSGRRCRRWAGRRSGCRCCSRGT